MFVVHIAAFLALLLCIAWRFKVKLLEAFPVGCALLVLMLYLLSFFRALSFSDVIAAAGLAGAVVWAARLPKEKRREFSGFARQGLLDAGTLTAFAMILVVTFCVKDKVVSWWDDYNFWATDVKSLFYLDGFAHKYANVAPEFGDYPPGTQMMKWWFLHFSPSSFHEGLMFAGYYFMNLSFLFPLLKVVRKRNILAMVAGAVGLWLFPAVAEVFWCEGSCADLTMAVVYGAFLTAVVDRRKGRLFYYGRQALFLAVLVLCKNTGFIWAGFGLLFDYGYHLLCRRGGLGTGSGQALADIGVAARNDSSMEGDSSLAGKDRKGRAAERWALLAVTLFPVLVEVSWLGFCLANRRVAKLTGTAFQMATGGMGIPAYQGEMVKAFVEAFIKWPLHRWKTFAIDLSPLALYLLLPLFIYLLYRSHDLDKRTARYTGIFLAVTGAVFYAINLLSHLTIFAVETQYLEPFGMVSSIERYGAPFTIGGLYLVAFCACGNLRPSGLALEQTSGRDRAGAILCLAFVLLTTDYGSAYNGLYGYRDKVADVLAERGEIVDEAAERFLKAVGAEGERSTGRVLYLRDISDVSWVRNTYVGFEAAPISVMYGNVDTEVLDGQGIINAIMDAHAGFLYVDELAGNGKDLFMAFLDGQEFMYGHLYQIVGEGNEIRLVE